MLRMNHFRSRVRAVPKWILAIVIAVAAVFPIWWMFNIVFTNPGVPASINPRLYPSSLSAGIQNIQKVLVESQFLHSYLVTLAYTVLECLGVLLLCSMAAFEFALFQFPGKKFFFSIALLSLMVPSAVTLIPTYLLVVDLGWLNSMQGLVVPGLASAFGLFMLTQFMEDIPHDLLDAARVDGANHFRLYWHVALPLSKNALVTLSILTFMSTWGNLLWPLVIATKPALYTVSRMVNWYNDPMSYTTVDVVMTANLLAAVPPVLFYLLFQRYVMKGITMTGLKG
ncbi:MAG TPA: carbohydrate ABC transporter permease [Anaerolineaceae bacterium]|nr:carbohydrate ABC transporter permease [Anaerolineaceae bacterium]